MSQSDSTSKFSLPPLGILERATELRIGLLLATLILSIDVMLSTIYGKNILSYSWQWGDGNLTFGVVLTGLGFYCLFMSIASPIFQRTVETLLLFLPIQGLFFTYDPRFDSDPLREVSKSELKHAAQERESDFMYKIYEKENDADQRDKDALIQTGRLSFSCIFLLALDMLASRTSLLAGIYDYVFQIPLYKAFIVEIIVIAIFLGLVLPWYFCFINTLNSRFIDYPSLAMKLRGDRYRPDKLSM